MPVTANILSFIAGLTEGSTGGSTGGGARNNTKADDRNSDTKSTVAQQVGRAATPEAKISVLGREVTRVDNHVRRVNKRVFALEKYNKLFHKEVKKKLKLREFESDISSGYAEYMKFEKRREKEKETKDKKKVSGRGSMIAGVIAAIGGVAAIAGYLWANHRDEIAKGAKRIAKQTAQDAAVGFVKTFDLIEKRAGILVDKLSKRLSDFTSERQTQYEKYQKEYDEYWAGVKKKDDARKETERSKLKTRMEKESTETREFLAEREKTIKRRGSGKVSSPTQITIGDDGKKLDPADQKILDQYIMDKEEQEIQRNPNKLRGRSNLGGMPPLPMQKPQTSMSEFVRADRNYQQRSQFLKFGALPPGFEHVAGNRGIMGNAIPVAAGGAQPFTSGVSSMGGGSYSSVASSGSGVSGASSMTSLSSSAEIPTGKRLKGMIDRTSFDDELKNPAVRTKFLTMMQAEVGSQGKEAQVAFAETVFNRAVVQGKSLDQILSNRAYYGPYKDGGWSKAQRALSGKGGKKKMEMLAKHLGTAHGGSDTTRGATHNASAGVASSVRRGGYDADTNTISKRGGETYYRKTYENEKYSARVKTFSEDQPDAVQSAKLGDVKKRLGPGEVTLRSTKPKNNGAEIALIEQDDHEYRMAHDKDYRKDVELRAGLQKPIENAMRLRNELIPKSKNTGAVEYTKKEASRVIAEAISLGEQGPSGKAIDAAAKKLGLHERRDRKEIAQFLRNNGGGIDPASTPWCAAFVNAALTNAGIKGTRSNVATSFLEWGALKKAAELNRGDVLVQHRGNRAGVTGGHVGLATGQTRMKDGRLEVEMLGGNQDNAVTKKWVGANEVEIRRATKKQMTARAMAEIKAAKKTIENNQKPITTQTPIKDIKVPEGMTDSLQAQHVMNKIRDAEKREAPKTMGQLIEKRSVQSEPKEPTQSQAELLQSEENIMNNIRTPKSAAIAMAETEEAVDVEGRERETARREVAEREATGSGGGGSRTEKSFPRAGDSGAGNAMKCWV